jgi:hypothetical protein
MELKGRSRSRSPDQRIAQSHYIEPNYRFPPSSLNFTSFPSRDRLRSPSFAIDATYSHLAHILLNLEHHVRTRIKRTDHRHRNAQVSSRPPGQDCHQGSFSGFCAASRGLHCGSRRTHDTLSFGPRQHQCRFSGRPQVLLQEKQDGDVQGGHLEEWEVLS